jgi:hypothetical protein
MDDRRHLIARFELPHDTSSRGHGEIVFDVEGSRLANRKPNAGALEVTRQ